MTDIHQRLRQARTDAGFEKMVDAPRHFGWKASTYAGHENGSRGIKQPDVIKYAEAFNVSPEWLFSGRTTRKSAPAPRAAGMAEPSVKPFVGQSDSQRRALLDLANHASAKPRHASLHQVSRDYPSFMLMKNDILIVDLKPQPKDGQIVLIQAPDRDTGEATTEIAIFSGGLLAPGYANATNVEGASIVGTIVFAVRQP